MKRNFLTKLMLAAGLLLAGNYVNAQVEPIHGGAIAKNLVSARFLVNLPASIGGLKKVTIAPWGAQPNTPLSNVPVAKGLDSLAAFPLTNPANVAGKFALLYRGGGISFVQKAQYAQNAGAIGIIIVNNISGDPVGMGGTTTAITIPVIMVSDVDGNAMNNQLRNNIAVTVTLGLWNIGGAHDLGILRGYAAAPHALNIPGSMWSNSANKFQYKNWVGGAVGNFGTATETNVTVSDSIVWVPNSGSPSLAKTNSYTIASIAPIDSFRFGFGPASASYYLTPQAGNGRYDYYSRISYGNTDGAPEDNVNKFSQYINDSIFCKGGYDYEKGEPRITQGIQVANGTSPFAMGPMYYVTKGQHAARAVQFYISKGATSPILNGSSASVLIYKWTDGFLGGSSSGLLDSVVATNELELVGYASKTFGVNDSGGKVYTFIPQNAISPNLSIRLDSNSWYWIPVQLQNDCFVGTDQGVSFFTRGYVQAKNGVIDFPEAAFFDDIDAALQGPAAGIGNYPFSRSSDGSVDSAHFDQNTQITNVALHISKNIPTSIKNENTVNIGSVNLYPNPAIGGFINVATKLEMKADHVNYRVVDNFGRLIADYGHNNVKEEKFQISTAGLASGTFYLIVDDGRGSLIRKFTVVN